MTKIIVLCDGTWNSPDMEDTTHVYALSKCMKNDGVEQKVAYFRGIGANMPREEGGSFVGNGINRILGGATGFGLGAKVREAYKFIAENYKDGDEIYLFGFSRGAYTARSVAGMLRKCGIVDYPSDLRVNRAFRLYRRAGKDNHPDRFHIRQARAALSPRFATSKKDQETRKDGPVPIVNVAYVGVWDTVGARGVPVALFGWLGAVFNRLYAFHDTDLSSLVRSARHALAVDERRVFYEPAMWDNLEKLNESVGERRYEQLWFVGDHGVVGGSVNTDPVSCVTLKWVADGADLDFEPCADLDAEKDMLAPLDRLKKDPKNLYLIAKDLFQWRRGIRSAQDVHPTVRERFDGDESYRPGSLSGIF